MKEILNTIIENDNIFSPIFIYYYFLYLNSKKGERLSK